MGFNHGLNELPFRVRPIIHDGYWNPHRAIVIIWDVLDTIDIDYPIIVDADIIEHINIIATTAFLFNAFIRKFPPLFLDCALCAFLFLPFSY